LIFSRLQGLSPGGDGYNKASASDMVGLTVRGSSPVPGGESTYKKIKISPGYI
jgi:hypothetical protein